MYKQEQIEKILHSYAYKKPIGNRYDNYIETEDIPQIARDITKLFDN